MKLMNYKLMGFIFSLSFAVYGEAQVTIGSMDAPDENALLDLKESGILSSKGLLLPRVELISLTDPSPLTMHIEGIIVYNTATTGPVPTGLYKNTGYKWALVQLPEGGTEGQFLVLDKQTLVPKWSTIFIPEVRVEEFSLIEVGAYSQNTGAEFTTNSGAVMYAENSTMTSSWKTITDPFKITVKKANNRIILFVQTTILQSTYSSSGWTSYAGGVFVNNLLKGIRVGTLRSSGNNNELSKSETLFFIIENLPIGENTIQIAFIRRNSNTTVPTLFVGKSLNSDITGSTSLSYQYYEK